MNNIKRLLGDCGIIKRVICMLCGCSYLSEVFSVCMNRYVGMFVLAFVLVCFCM